MRASLADELDGRDTFKSAPSLICRKRRQLLSPGESETCTIAHRQAGAARRRPKQTRFHCLGAIICDHFKTKLREAPFDELSRHRPFDQLSHDFAKINAAEGHVAEFAFYKIGARFLEEESEDGGGISNISNITHARLPLVFPR